MRLYDFAYHSQSKGWLDQVALQASEEPWGPKNKILEIYLQTNFEIVQKQGGVHEHPESDLAFWRAGNLVNNFAAPLWLVYKPNPSKENPRPWAFDYAKVGRPPSPVKVAESPVIDIQKYVIKYGSPDLERDWTFNFDHYNFEHIFRDNRSRLEKVFREAMSGKFNEHIVSRTVYAEIEFKLKQGVVQTQWYQNDYQFLMPLYLTKPDHVDLVAALQPDNKQQCYIVRTLLSPRYAYARARAVVRSRDVLPNWLRLSDEELNQSSLDDFDEEQ